ncbi:acetyl-CoA carboxylase biotin carboxyl carrier protein [Mucisphaera calidilacus]|uniref:Biotin carboxyl carrier protein of acetyl-CoA carboxylase n=1 Tax=Mucisphaera calidilacus TaxID=2527982 RepID=A0A518BY39_9BACT|nr:acetyl-CoA carboxylase biotin carboxyl carrier protein [Mucisphaera calidilacus]QDU71897.1 Acetyl-CoA biotin carboxyl carrier [Mucisphaera calidilacus]
MTDLKTLRQLIKMMVDHDLTEVDVEGEDGKVRLRRGGKPVESGGGVPTVVLNPAAGAPPAAPAPAAGAAAPAGGGEAPVAEDPNLVTINSPMVGTYYASSSPDAPAYVKVGDTVTAETVICLIEAMKVFNEIKAEASGTVAEILVKNGEAVEFGQPIMKIRPN